MKLTLRAFLLAGAAVLAAAPAARAGFDIQVFVGGALVDTINKGGGLDLSTNPNTITVDTGALNTDLTNMGFGIQFGSLSATSTSTDPTQARLSVNGAASETTPGATETVQILSSFSGYPLPAGPAREFTSSNSDNFSFFAPGTNRNFTSYFISDPNALNSTAGTPSPTTTFTPVAGLTSDGQTTLPTIVPYPGQYTLTNVSNITLASFGNATPDSSALDNFGGTTTVRAVPEPASIGLLLAGGLLALRARRKRVA